MADTILVRYSRAFPVPVPDAYAWLTDYRDDDPSRTEHLLVSRPVRSRAPDKVVLEGTLELLDRRGTSITEVDLLPPDRWRARIVQGWGRGSVYEYRLTPTGDGGSRLDIEYRFHARRLRSKLLLLFGKRRVRAELDRMWSGFAASLEKDLRGS